MANLEELNFSKRKIERVQGKVNKHRFIKLTFISLVIFMIGGLLLWPYLKELPLLFLKEKMNLKIKGLDLSKKQLLNPRFIGGGEHPYTILATLAQQVSPTKVILENVRARISLKGGGILEVIANGGDIITEGEKTANLYGDVNFIYDKADTELWTESAFINLNKSFMEGFERIEGESLYGHLKAQGFYLNQTTNFLKLKGPADLIIIEEQKN